MTEEIVQVRGPNGDWITEVEEIPAGQQRRNPVTGDWLPLAEEPVLTPSGVPFLGWLEPAA